MWDPLGATIKVMYFSLWQQMSLFLILLYFTEKPWSYIYYNCKPKTTYTLCQVQHSISRTLLLHTIWCAGGGMGKPSRTLYYIYTQSITLYKYIGIVSIFYSAYMQCSFHNQNTSSVVSAWIVCKPCRCTSTALSVHNSTTTTFTHAKHK